MRELTFKVPKAKLESVKQFYTNNLANISKAGIFFAALKENVRVVALDSGTVNLKGDNPTPDFVLINALASITNYPSIGTAFVGDTDIFGPLVVCSVYLKQADLDYLKTLNLPSINELKVADIVKHAPNFSKMFANSLMVLDPHSFNAMSTQEYSLNRIKATLLNRCLIKLTAKLYKDAPVLVNQFCNVNHYFNYLKDEPFVFNDIYFDAEADQLNLSMVVAKIIASYAFLASLQKLTKIVNQRLKRGNNREVVHQLIELYKVSPLSISQIAKLAIKPANRLNLKLPNAG